MYKKDELKKLEGKKFNVTYLEPKFIPNLLEDIIIEVNETNMTFVGIEDDIVFKSYKIDDINNIEFDSINVGIHLNDGHIIMLQEQRELLTILKDFSSLSTAGNCISKILDNISVKVKGNIIKIIGIGIDENEQEVENDSFTIDMNNIKSFEEKYIGNDERRVNLYTKDNRFIILDTF